MAFIEDVKMMYDRDFKNDKTQNFTSDTFLVWVYNLDVNPEKEEVTYFIFDNFDRFFHDGEQDKVNEIIKHVDVNQLSTFACRSLLSASSWDKNNLSEWFSFRDKVYNRISIEKGEELAKKILGGFYVKESNELEKT